MKKGETRASGDSGKIPPFGGYDAVQQQLKSLKEPKGVLKDDNGKVNPTLTAPEVARYKNIFGILKEVLFPGPEAERISKTGLEDKVPGMSQVAGATAAPKVKSAMGLNWRVLLGILGAALVTGITVLLDEVGQFFLKMGLKVLKFIKPIINFAKTIGTMFSKGFFKAMKAIKPLMTIVSKVGDFFGGIYKGIKSSKAMKALLKGGKSVMGMMKKAGAAVWTKLKKAGRFIPFIGSIFSFAFAIEKFRKGDYVGMLGELLSGVLNFIPVVGNIGSGLVDAYLLIRETQEYDEGEKGTWAGEGKMLGRLWDKVKSWFGENMHKLPIIGGLYKMGEAAGHLMNGKWVPGLRALAQVLPSWFGGGIGADLAGKGFDFVYGLFSGEYDIDYNSVVPNFDGTEFGDMIGGLFSSIGEVLGDIFTGLHNYISDWVVSVKDNLIDTVKTAAPAAFGAIPGLNLVGNIIGYINGGDEEASANTNTTAGSSVASRSNSGILGDMRDLDHTRNVHLKNMEELLTAINEKLGIPQDNYGGGPQDGNVQKALNPAQ